MKRTSCSPVLIISSCIITCLPILFQTLVHLSKAIKTSPAKQAIHNNEQHGKHDRQPPNILHAHESPLHRRLLLSFVIPPPPSFFIPYNPTPTPLQSWWCRPCNPSPPLPTPPFAADAPPLPPAAATAAPPIMSCCSATSAASSFALLTYWPSYQKRAWMTCCPEMVTVEDQAVRPPRRSETMLKTGAEREKRAQCSVWEGRG